MNLILVRGWLSLIKESFLIIGTNNQKLLICTDWSHRRWRHAGTKVAEYAEMEILQDKVTHPHLPLSSKVLVYDKI